MQSKYRYRYRYYIYILIYRLYRVYILFLKEREIYKEKESSLSLLAAWISCDTISVSNPQGLNVSSARNLYLLLYAAITALLVDK